MSNSVLTPADLQRVESLQIVVKEETPFLPKVAFTLITLASLAGAIFTGLGFGLEPLALGLRWFALWALALAGGFATWRLFYLREAERDLDDEIVGQLNSTALKRARRVSVVVGALVILSAFGTLSVGYLDYVPAARWLILAGTLALGIVLLAGVQHRGLTTLAFTLTAALILGWALFDAGTGWEGAVRLAHLSLWLGGALWNIAVAMPAGREHPTVTAVLAGARQLDRFRWVVRFSLPTIIITGLIMAGFYTVMPLEWWLSFPGVLLPLKVMAIVVLVVVFITCPLFRQCSPVQGVCNIDDLDSTSRNSAPRT
ncbi:MAG TPA: hypothetical protein PK890_02535 [Terrimesophilobacter sp.]|nr:hypothetical protein [Terrimesophilobacter sp.]